MWCVSLIGSFLLWYLIVLYLPAAICLQSAHSSGNCSRSEGNFSYDLIALNWACGMFQHYCSPTHIIYNAIYTDNSVFKCILKLCVILYSKKTHHNLYCMWNWQSNQPVSSARFCTKMQADASFLFYYFFIFEGPTNIGHINVVVKHAIYMYTIAGYILIQYWFRTRMIACAS